MAAPVRASDAADSEIEQRLLACDDIDSPTGKLACFNAVIESLKDSPAESAAVSSPASGPDSVSRSAAERATTKVPSQATSAAGGPEPPADAPARQPAGTPRVPTGAFPAEARHAGGDIREAETVRRDGDEKKREEEVVQATIVRSWQNLDGRFSVELDNGQIWRETQGTRVGMPEEGNSVELSKGFLGGYRMKIEGITRIAWVRRTK